MTFSTMAAAAAAASNLGILSFRRWWLANRCIVYIVIAQLLNYIKWFFTTAAAAAVAASAWAPAYNCARQHYSRERFHHFAHSGFDLQSEWFICWAPKALCVGQPASRPGELIHTHTLEQWAAAHLNLTKLGNRLPFYFIKFHWSNRNRNAKW